MTTLRVRSAVVAIAALLPVGATVLAVAVAISERLGYEAFSRGGAANAAEAAALGHPAEMLRYLVLGQRPDEVMRIRPDVISSSVLAATPLEAAMWARERQMIQLLDTRGAIVGSETRHHLACLAKDLDLPDIVEYLAPTGLGMCGADEGIHRVLARRQSS